MTRQRGFTLIELAIVLSIGVVLVPLVWTFGAHLQDQRALATFQLEAAVGVRSLSEELRRDARAGRAADGDEVRFSRDGCGVRYVVNDEAVLVREGAEACGGTRGLARWVESATWTPGGVEVRFARALRPHRVHRITVFIPVEGR